MYVHIILCWAFYNSKSSTPNGSASLCGEKLVDYICIENRWVSRGEHLETSTEQQAPRDPPMHPTHQMRTPVPSSRVFDSNVSSYKRGLLEFLCEKLSSPSLAVVLFYDLRDRDQQCQWGNPLLRSNSQSPAGPESYNETDEGGQAAAPLPALQSIVTSR